jgi:hypothetical protein
VKKLLPGRREGSLTFYDEILNGLTAYRLKSEEVIAVKTLRRLRLAAGRT